MEKPLPYDFTVSNRGSGIGSSESKIEIRKRSMQRTRSILRRLINANAWRWNKPNGEVYPPIFVTLTFAENTQNTKTANFLFSKFIKRLTYYIGEQKKSFLKYVVVTEFQKRGAIHYHAIFFNLEHVRTNVFAKIWGQGFVKMNMINDVSNVGAYVCKYMGKDFDDDRLDGKKRYFCSKRLNKPTSIRDEKRARAIVEKIPKELIKFQKFFETSHQGIVKYTQCQIDKQRSFKEIIPQLYDYPC
jgi:hypothetical protein